MTNSLVMFIFQIWISLIKYLNLEIIYEILDTYIKNINTAKEIFHINKNNLKQYEIYKFTKTKQTKKQKY